LHKRFDLRKKRLVRDVRVVLSQQRGIRLEHLAATNLKIGLLEAFDHLSDSASGDTVGFQKN